MLRTVLLPAWLLIVPMVSMAQSWNLVVFDPREGRPWPATLELTEKDGAATVRTVRGNVNDACLKPTKAAVERSATTITITQEPLMPGCAHLRYVINADGTGGKVQRRADPASEWVDDPRDRKLTLMK